MAAKYGPRRKKPGAWNAAKSEYFLKWDAIKGEQIPKDTLEFFIHVKDKLGKPFDDPEDKDLFIENVFSQTKGEESPLIRNSLVSQIVEQLIPGVSDEVLLEFATAVSQQITELSEDQFASHVLQTLLLSITCRVQAGKSSVQPELERWVVSAADRLLQSLPALACHQYGSHVLRTALECLSGCRAPPGLTRSRRSQQQRWRDQQTAPVTLDKARAPHQLTEKFVELAKAVKNWDRLAECLADQNFSTIVQLVLHILHALPLPKLSRKLIKRLMKVNFGAPPPGGAAVLPPVFAAESQLRVLEAALASCEEEVFQKLARKYYTGRLHDLLRDNLSAISVQRLVEACPSGEALECIVDELDSDSESAPWWTAGRLPTALALACVRLHSCQARLVKLACRLCDCEAPDRTIQLAPCLLYQLSWSDLERLRPHLPAREITMDGSLLVQALLKFSKPTKLITSLLSLSAGLLAAIVQSPAGSHVIDALVTSPHMGEKGRTKLLETLKEELVSLACSKHGSRALDALWTAGSPGQRTFIAETLSPHEARLRQDFFGKFAVRNFALPLFAKKRADWTAYVKREANKRKMFADLLPSNAGSPAGATAGKRGAQSGKRGGGETAGADSAPKRTRPDADLFVIDRQGVQGVLDDLE